MSSRSSKSNHNRIIPQVIFWILTLLWFFFCLYLSWQTGEETVGFSQQISQLLLELLSKLGIRPDAPRFHAGLRLFAHFGVFLMTGVLFAASLEVSLPGGAHKNIKVLLIGSLTCAFIAVAAEVGKLAVPGRHLTWSETWLNVLGSVCGVAAVCLLVCLCASRKAKHCRPRE